MNQTTHKSVLLKETVDRLAIKPGGIYLDATLGGGGHSAEILLRGGPDCTLVGIDRDREAIERTSKRLENLPGKKVYIHGNHSDLAELSREAGFEKFDGILLDTGVSSDQLDTAGRGFSFRNDGPLDMRMDTSRGQTAADIVATYDAQALADIFRKLGEEPMAMRIARGIVAAREKAPVTTTAQLAAIVADTLGGAGRARGHHPATRVFQALRMTVNAEMESLQKALDGAISCLRENGRLAVITFESLTDRLVKQCFAAHAGKNISLQQGGSRWEGILPRLRLVDRHPLIPGDDEIAENPRSRSAKLRTVTPFSEEVQ